MIDRQPPFFGEDYFFALLLRMVLEHCSTLEANEVDSYARESNADAMQVLEQAGYLEIIHRADGRIRATVLPEAHALVARLLAEKDSGR
jgi:hypothetical protein